MGNSHFKAMHTHPVNVSEHSNNYSVPEDDIGHQLNFNSTKINNLPAELVHFPRTNNAQNQTIHSYHTFIQDSFFYQHIFNLSMVVIFLLQLVFLWVFVIRRRQVSSNNNAGNDINLDGLIIQPNPALAIVVHAGAPVDGSDAAPGG